MSSIYRPAALEDRLNVNYFRFPVKIVQVPQALFVTAVFFATIITMLWSFCYQVPEYAMADGIVLVPGSVVQVKTELEGANFEICPCHEIRKGEVIAQFETRQLDIEIEMMRGEIEFLTKSHDKTNDLETGAFEELSSITGQQIAESERMIEKFSPLIEAAQAGIAVLEEINQESPYRSTGFPSVIPRVIIDKKKESLNQQSQVHDLKSRTKDRLVALADKKTELEINQTERTKVLEDKRRELKEKEKLRNLRFIKAPHDGRVLSFSKVDGDSVSKDDVVCKLIRTDLGKENQKCVAYFDVGAGSKVRLGDLAFVTPNTYLREKDGSIRGIVTKTNEFLSSPESAAALLGHSELATVLQKNGSNLKEIEICLLSDFQMYVVNVVKVRTQIDLLDRKTFIASGNIQEQLQLLRDLHRQSEQISNAFATKDLNVASVSIKPILGRTMSDVEITRNQFQQFNDYSWTGSAPTDFYTVDAGTTASIRIQIGSKPPVSFAYETLGRWLGNSDKDRLSPRSHRTNN